MLMTIFLVVDSILCNSSGDTTMVLHTDYDNTGDSRIITDDLAINGGSDLAELFDITDNDSEVIPGAIVCIDPISPGKLMLSQQAYDQKVAGVISGANAIKPGILMAQKESIASGSNHVTLSGRTYVRVNTTNGKIKVGDFITSSDRPGEGMRATNYRKSEGAIIGKAMTTLDEGSGYVLVLITL